MVIPPPDVVGVFIGTISLVIVPDAVKFNKPLMLLLCKAMSAPSDIPVMMKPMIVVFMKFISFIGLDFKVSCIGKNMTTHGILINTVRAAVWKPLC